MAESDDDLPSNDDDEFIQDLTDLNPDAMAADGFDDAMVGYTVPCGGRKALAVYDYELCVGVLVKRDGMSEEEAVEYMDFNVVGAYVGESTPLFLITRSA